MNKKILFHTILGCLAALAATGCYDDDSTYAEHPIGDVTVNVESVNFLDETSGAIRIPALDTLDIKVSASKENDPDVELEYSWEITPVTFQTHTEIIGNGPELSYVVHGEINPTDPYMLILTVTDKATGIKVFKQWKLFITDKYGEVLIVADTKNGETTDFSYVLNNRISYNIGREGTDRNLYSAANGEGFAGLVRQMVYANTPNGGRIIYLITEDKNLYAVNAINFSTIGSGKELFSTGADLIGDISAENLDWGPYSYIYLNNNGTLYHTDTDREQKFGFVSVTGTPAYRAQGRLYPYNIRWVRPAGTQTSTRAWFFDSAEGTIRTVTGVSGTSPSSKILVSGLAGCENVGGGVNNNNRLQMIIRDNAAGTWTVYTGYNGTEAVQNGDSYSPIADIDNVSAMPVRTPNNITAQSEFAVCGNQPVIYYSTPSAVYAINTLSGSAVPQAEAKYSAPAGEEITHIEIYRQSWHLKDREGFEYYYYENPIPEAPLNNKALLVTTYNQSTGEGKVRILPMENFGSGDLDSSDQLVFDGFGRILAVAPSAQ